MRYILISSLFCVFSLSAQKEKVLDTFSIKCTYSLEYQVDSTDINNRENEYVYLMIGQNGKSISSTFNTYHIDSVGAIVDKKLDQGLMHPTQAIGAIVNLPKSKFNFRVVKNYPLGSVKTLNKITKNFYLYEESVKDFNWKVFEEQKEVSGYMCRKATTKYDGRNYTAWFTDEIPINDGPYKFSGLPGLIIEISDENNFYNFKLTELQKIKEDLMLPNVIAINKDKTFVVSHNEYKETLSRFMKNTANFYEQEGYPKIDDAHTKRLNDRFKIRNNTIEVLK